MLVYKNGGVRKNWSKITQVELIWDFYKYNPDLKEKIILSLQLLVILYMDGSWRFQWELLYRAL